MGVRLTAILPPGEMLPVILMTQHPNESSLAIGQERGFKRPERRHVEMPSGSRARENGHRAPCEQRRGRQVVGMFLF